MLCMYASDYTRTTQYAEGRSLPPRRIDQTRRFTVYIAVKTNRPLSVVQTDGQVSQCRIYVAVSPATTAACIYL